MVTGGLPSPDVHALQPSKSPAVTTLGKHLISGHEPFTAFPSPNPEAGAQGHTQFPAMTARYVQGEGVKPSEEHALPGQTDLVSGNMLPFLVVQRQPSQSLSTSGSPSFK